jgi:hypothetical protein
VSWQNLQKVKRFGEIAPLNADADIEKEAEDNYGDEENNCTQDSTRYSQDCTQDGTRRSQNCPTDRTRYSQDRAEDRTRCPQDACVSAAAACPSLRSSSRPFAAG